MVNKMTKRKTSCSGKGEDLRDTAAKEGARKQSKERKNKAIL
jgi:hypothetical protein